MANRAEQRRVGIGVGLSLGSFEIGQYFRSAAGGVSGALGKRHGCEQARAKKPTSAIKIKNQGLRAPRNHDMSDIGDHQASI